VVNLQGDEPEVSPLALDRVVEMLERDADCVMSTLGTPITDEEIFLDPACVKVVFGSNGRALYFSRSPIPCHRDGLPGDGVLGHLHLGLYAYRRAFLLELAQRPTSPLEKTEKLEQLRVLEAGYSIAVGVIEEPAVGIDTPADYARFVERWRAGAGRAA
jgi:3-deoxy-manno-octulosonate cytidylyltransferase (CMP-KDO synthetase)